jgi:hypothetical protein
MGAKLYLETYEVDTLGDIDVDFTYSIADITDIERRSTSYSKTIVLPSTTRNQKIFGNIFDISVENDYDENDRNVLSNFNPSKQAKAQIFLDNVKIFDGVLRLIKINNKNGDITYETNVFGRLRDILHTLGDKTLADLNFVDYDHTWNNNTIAQTWNRTEWVDGANNYVYPLVDYGYTLDGVTYPLISFKPAVFIREILKRIFAESGFEIRAPFFDTQYFKKLILVTAEKSITKQVSTLLNQTSGFEDYIGNTQYWTKAVAFTSVAAEGFTINPQGTRFTWNRAQTLNTGVNFNHRIQLLAQEGGTAVYWTMTVKKNGSQIMQNSRTVYFTSQYQTYFWDWSATWAGDIAQGDYFEVYIEADRLGFGQFPYTNPYIDTLVICLDMNLVIGNTVPVAVDLTEGDTMKISYTLPKSMKQRDFLKSIITMHNLYILQDKLQDNVLEIIPYPLFYKAYKDEALDWTNKLDVSQDVAILPTSEITAKEYRIQFDDDNDYWGQFYKAKYNEGYGESRVILDNDFELDTQTLKVIFGAPVMREEVQGRIMLHLYKVENGVKVKDNFKPRIAYWKPEVQCPTMWTMSYNAGSSSYSAYPYAGHLNDPTDPVADLLFGTPKEVYFSISVYPGANLYGAYYEPLISLIGDKDSRVLQGNFYLTPQDIMDLDFRRIIKVGKHFYQLQKVDRFNPIANTTSYVSLFKILKDLQPTDYDFILLETDFYMLQENGVSRFYI